MKILYNDFDVASYLNSILYYFSVSLIGTLFCAFLKKCTLSGNACIIKTKETLSYMIECVNFRLIRNS